MGLLPRRFNKLPAVIFMLLAIITIGLAEKVYLREDTLRTIQVGRGSVNRLYFSSDGNKIISNEINGRVSIIDVKHGSVNGITKEKKFSVISVNKKKSMFIRSSFNPNNIKLGLLQMHLYDSGRIVWTVVQKGSVSDSISFLEKTKLVAILNSVGVMELRNICDGRLIKSVRVDGSSFSLSYDEKIAAISDINGLLKFYDTSTNKLVKIIHIRVGKKDKYSFGQLQGVSCLVFGKDGVFYVGTYSSHGNSLQRYNLEDTNDTSSSDDKVTVLSIAISPNQKMLATSGADGTLVVRDPKSLKILKTLSGEKDRIVSSVVFSPDSESIVAGCTNGTVEIWNLKT